MRIKENSSEKIVKLFDSSDEQAFSFYCEKNSNLDFVFLITNSFNLKIDIFLEGENSSANVYGAYLLKEEGTVQINTSQNHLSSNSVTNLDIRGLLTQNSKSNYSGKIFVDKNAPFSSATQLNKNILISDKSFAVSTPSLEVLTDNVKCAHGSASGPIDNNQIFYLLSRGLSEKDAKRLILRSFFGYLKLPEFLDSKLTSLLGAIDL